MTHWRGLPLLKEILHGQSDVFRDLAQKDWRNVASDVERNGGGPAVGVTELLMRTALANFLKGGCPEFCVS